MSRVILTTLVLAILLPGCAINSRLSVIENYIETDKANTQVLVDALNKHSENLDKLKLNDALVQRDLMVINCYLHNEPGLTTLDECIKEVASAIEETKKTNKMGEEGHGSTGSDLTKSGSPTTLGENGEVSKSDGTASKN
jgi:hypothetical protein